MGMYSRCVVVNDGRELFLLDELIDLVFALVRREIFGGCEVVYVDCLPPPVKTA